MPRAASRHGFVRGELTAPSLGSPAPPTRANKGAWAPPSKTPRKGEEVERPVSGNDRGKTTDCRVDEVEVAQVKPALPQHCGTSVPGLHHSGRLVTLTTHATTESGTTALSVATRRA
ncbi:hypothetical protein MTO96_009817 [Rhipicephalus appendiculatus]